MKVKQSFLGSNIRHLCEIEDISMEKLADIVGTTGAEIGLLKRNKVKGPNFFLIEAIADYFGIEVSNLVRQDLTDLDFLHVKIMRANRNIINLNDHQLRTYLALTEDLIQLEVEEGYFRTKNRNN